MSQKRLSIGISSVTKKLEDMRTSQEENLKKALEIEGTEGMRQASQDSGIVEASANQGLGRDHGGNSGEDRGQLPEASQGLRRSRRWPFRIINSCFLFFSCYVMFLNKI